MEEPVNSRPISVKWALIFAIISLVYTIGTAMGRIQIPFVGWLISVAIIGLCFMMALKEYKQQNSGYIAFGKGFRMGMFISLIGGLIRSVVFYVYLTVDPEYIEFIKEAQKDSPFGPPPEESQEQMQGFIDFFSSPEFMASASFIGAIFGGLIIGAIVAAIMKTEEEEF